MLIDAQYNTTTVTKHARHRSGLDRWDCPVFPPKPILAKPTSGKWFRAEKKRWPLGVSLLKTDLYNRIKLDESSKESVEFCEGLPKQYCENEIILYLQ